ncbi:uridine diphosphate glucose pyrophosphatase NUDT14-like isoform X2 [Pollicipes pollicipes]|uniref:uridine diphosphate glucose pyrophosphatase NUDT14-like isoform X2 n=1 Tax=Pollicipes pollicipes TaxID=41117 RepID=UPI001885505A|nr:uridine diphosphate glucose pyrophosphatase NUDT14-like isoform X2 [Pollicipes pollicipes]
MDNITDVSTEPLGESHYVKPLRMHYKQNGVAKSWDLMKVHDAVAVLIHNTSRNVLVFVRQFRPAVYLGSLASSACTDPSQVELGRPADAAGQPGSRGVTLELCAGCVDKRKTLLEIAREEVLEECGYDVPLDRFERIKSFVCNEGTSGDLMTVFHVSVTDTDRTGPGGGNPEEGEVIEVVEMTIDQVRQYVSQDDVLSPPGFLFCIYWFFMHKLKQSL